MATALDQVRALIRDVPDFPQPGILFKDLTPVLGDPAAFRAVIDELSARLRGKGFHRIVAIESRGFLFGAPLADRLGLGIAPIRVIAAAASLWGRSLTEERDARLADGAGPAAVVARRLTAELTARLDDAAGRAAPG